MTSNLQKMFDKNDFVLVKNFIDAESITTISKYMENVVNRYSPREPKDSISNYSCYADPLIEVVLANSLESVQELTGKELYPTYSYSRVYTGNNELEKHVDRPSCEYSLSVNVATVGSPWPFWVRNGVGVEASFILNPGDALLYKGEVVEHWREPMKDLGVSIVAQFMLHYVDKNGPHAHCKWDKREKLGLDKSKGV